MAKKLKRRHKYAIHHLTNMLTHLRAEFEEIHQSIAAGEEARQLKNAIDDLMDAETALEDIMTDCADEEPPLPKN